jgi:short-subunit dehydrogenase
MAKELANLKIAVTGGARGIGRATAARLAAAGARVVIGDRDHDVAAAAAAELGHGVSALPLDVAEPESWQAFVAEAGPLDVLVNNAGIMPLGAILQEPDRVTRTILDVNLMGVVNGTKAVAPGMAGRGGGLIVNVASGVGRVAMAGGATYTASKFAVVGFSEATRAELEPVGVEVCLVMPTVVRTDLAAGVPQARFVKQVLPGDVAEAIEATIRKPRPERWVPGWTQGMTKFSLLLPRAVQQGIAKVFRADVLADVDPAARAAYEAKVRGLGGVTEDERTGS